MYIYIYTHKTNNNRNDEPPQSVLEDVSSKASKYGSPGEGGWYGVAGTPMHPLTTGLNVVVDYRSVGGGGEREGEGGGGRLEGGEVGQLLTSAQFEKNILFIYFQFY